jgi:ribonuclease E
MGLIVRTAGLSRTKVEIKRDFDYLARLWDEIRERTLSSTAPALIYRDSDLIKRAIRDLYHREIDEVVVEGEEGYKAARGFMKLLMPSHVRRVKQHVETTPLFQRSGVEDQLSAMYQPVVQLKSGGYLVINPTEALVSIDINSGRSTREHNIEQTAFATNLEAAAEIARQLRLRDMAGLVVIDFIDMEQNSHVRKVEKAMKEALKNDRARIQIGRISSFGLMEMSRQRLRTGVLEASTKPCPHCDGTGLMRTAASAGLSALRIIEDEAARGRGDRILLRAGREAAVYVLNKKRAELADIELRYGVSIEILIDESFEGARMAVESSGPRPIAAPRAEIPAVDEEDELDIIDEVTADEGEDEDAEDEEDTVEISLEGEASDARGERERDGDDERHGRKRRRRRRGGRGRGRREGGDHSEAEEGAADADEPISVDEGDGEAAVPAEPTEEAASATRSRRRRGGRKPAAAEVEIEPDSSPMVERPIDEEPPIAETVPAEELKPKRKRSKKAVAEADVAVPEPASAEAPPAATAEASAEPVAAKPPRKRGTKKAAEADVEVEQPVPAAANSDTEADDDGQPRRGWWQRTFG